jgi:hypothetical protein
MVHLTFNTDADNMVLLPTGDLLSSRNKLLTLSHTTGKAEDFKCEHIHTDSLSNFRLLMVDRLVVYCFMAWNLLNQYQMEGSLQ